MVNNEQTANKTVSSCVLFNVCIVITFVTTYMYLGELNVKANEIPKYERKNLEYMGISVEYTHLLYVFNVMVLEPLGTI
jgi:hypothetical protein